MIVVVTDGYGDDYDEYDAHNDASFHTVRTGVGLVTSSSEVNSSHAFMALDNSLSTCFMLKDVSQYEHVVSVVLMMLNGNNESLHMAQDGAGKYMMIILSSI